MPLSVEVCYYPLTSFMEIPYCGLYGHSISMYHNCPLPSLMSTLLFGTSPLLISNGLSIRSWHDPLSLSIIHLHVLIINSSMIRIYYHEMGLVLYIYIYILYLMAKKPMVSCRCSLHQIEQNHRGGKGTGAEGLVDLETHQLQLWFGVPRARESGLRWSWESDVGLSENRHIGIMIINRNGIYPIIMEYSYILGIYPIGFVWKCWVNIPNDS